MSQQEVLKAVNDLRRISPKWHTSREIINYMKNNCNNGTDQTIRSDLLRLSMFNFIQVRGVGVWQHHKEFRGFKNAR